jgi:peptidyl-prolyl cis-trans isomerase D
MIRFLQTPGPIKKYVLGGVLVIICISMAWYLVPTGGSSGLGLGGPEKGVVARVGGENVTVQEVQRQARQMLEQQFPRGGAQASMLLPYFTPRAAENLIARQAVIAEAQRLGLRTNDEELRDELQHNPQYAGAFFPGGNFIGQDEYEGRLQQAGLTISQFEQGAKEDILISKLRKLIAASAIVADADVRKEFIKQNTKVKFDYAVLSKEDILKQVHFTDAELRAFYESNKANYSNAIPEKRKVKYVLIDTAKIQAETAVTRQDLMTYYDQHRDDFRAAEQVNVRHILVKTPSAGTDGKVDPKGLEEARKKAEDILKQVKAGGNFADLAKKYSDDPSSAKNGGSLGWIGRGRAAPEFDKAAFSLPKGATSDLVLSSSGFHIIHVDDKQDAHVKTPDEVKDQVEPILKQQKAAQAGDAQASALLAQARSGGLDKAAAAKGLPVITTDFVANTDSLPGIGSSPQFMEALFGAADKSPAAEVQLPQGFAVFQLIEIKPPATPSFEDIRSRVETEFKNQRGAALLSQKVQELSDRAKAEHDLKKAAKELGATLKTSDFVLPDGQVPDIGSMSGPAALAFTMKPGDISAPIAVSNSGIVLAILEKQDPTDQDFAAKKDEIHDSLLQAKQNELFNLFVVNLRQQMEKSGRIKINQEEMKNLTRAQGSEEGE